MEEISGFAKFSRDSWMTHYDKWYQLDLEILEKIIREGETSLYRALNKYQLIVDSQTKSYDGEPADKDVKLIRTKIDHSRCPSLLPTGKPLFLMARMCGQTIPVPYYSDTSYFAARYLLDVAKDLSPQAIVELGAGDGSRLFDLDLFGIDRSIPMFAAEQSKHGREITNTLCGMDAGINISSHPFDFDKPDYSFIKEYDNILVFTHMTVMLIRELGDEFVLKLVNAAKKVTCIHFESFGHQFSTPDNEINKEQVEHFESRGWNMTFLSVLDRLNKEGRIANLTIIKDAVHSQEIYTPRCIVSWESP